MPKTILVQEPDVLISLDLAQTVMETWPDARVILCRDVPQILAVLTEGQCPDLLIIRQSLRSLRGFGLAGLVQHPQVKVLLTAADEDDAAEVAALGWQSLDMPFFAAQVRDALHGACPEPRLRVETHCNAIGLG
ncbi:MAG: hypothetical protein Q7J44_04240 [Pseudotabrizicola sp.]|uniref:hypothetical protein n=1 Tax=Pseudotabrizicola sp. TaxID=2939647 RepID=UPI0027183FBA|nr:hypothetical protein [Pseudotabrizicola sp.]MDO9637729.1 hypothetical protein [Pseudotabrizicola sp.]